MSPITWFAVTGAAPSARLPAAGAVTTFTLISPSPPSVSVKAKSTDPNRYAVSSSIVTVRSADVGAALPDTVPVSASRVSVLLSSSVSITSTFSFLPPSADVTTCVDAVPRSVSLPPSTRTHW